MKTSRFLLAVSIVLAMALTFFTGCSVLDNYEGLPDCTKNIKLADSVTYERCTELVNNNKNCTGYAIWTVSSGSCECERAASCKK
jgi:hypothetical protein